jgi:hypothetical protein
VGGGEHRAHGGRIAELRTEIKEYKPIGTRWKDHDAYNKALERLPRDLRVEQILPSGKEICGSECHMM